MRDEDPGHEVQLAKVRPPVLRDETLERPRLLDWLQSKIHGRVVLVIADAGYGKTTLLADFSRRSRTRTLWYRLDESDREWTTFLRHLVAAGREHDPSFGSQTTALLAPSGAAELSLETVLATLIHELASFVPGGAVLILDDFHVVDDSTECRLIARELVARAPERMCIVFASRQLPSIPFGKLRAVGEVAVMATDSLRFDMAETGQLFSETYGRPLASDLVDDLARRTEGWIASLELVDAALRNRSPAEVGRFVKNLHGADHDLYDFLAEVVVGELPEELQAFLMATSILQAVTPALAQAASGREPEDVDRLLTAAERLTLLSRVSGASAARHRFHPLVREFLESRLHSKLGSAAVRDLHRSIAANAAADWRVAAHHYREAADRSAMLETLNAAIPVIMGNAQYASAQAFIGDMPHERLPGGPHLIRSRVDMQSGDYEAAERSAQAVLDVSPADPIQRDHALLNLLAVSFNYGHGERALQVAHALMSITADQNLRSIAEASIAIMEVSTEKDLDQINRKLRQMAKRQQADHAHHFGVSMYNLAANSVVQDRLIDAEREVDEALRAFSETSSLVERQAATVLGTVVLLRRGRHAEAAVLLGTLDVAGQRPQNDALLEAADAFDAYGNKDTAWNLLDLVGHQSSQSLADRRLQAITAARAQLRRGRADDAEAALAQYPDGVSTTVGMSVNLSLLAGHIALLRGNRDCESLLESATALASLGGIHSARRVAEILIATTKGPERLKQVLSVIAESSPWHLTEVAEVLVPLLPSIGDDGLRHVAEAARLHPERWRAALRSFLDRPTEVRLEHCLLLEEIGERSDIPRLRAFARANRANRRAAVLGRDLARRLADRIYVEDQGRVRLRIGQREVSGSSVRRKVLALLCLLISKSGMSATRDQVLDALWPDLDPEAAANSLNQTLYFLRRVFDESYSEDLSAPYVHHEGDVIWLDPELVSSRSAECWRSIRSMGDRPSPDEVDRLTAAYKGRFALDFEYEEWASGYRDLVHAAYLEIVERSILDDVAAGHHDRAIRVARRALDADPRSDQIEASLLSLYTSTGAHAAAAEQYSHYASVLRDDLGLEPPPLGSL